LAPGHGGDGNATGGLFLTPGALLRRRCALRRSQLLEKRKKPFRQRLIGGCIEGTFEISVDFLIDLRISLRALGRHILGVTSGCVFVEP